MGTETLIAMVMFWLARTVKNPRSESARKLRAKVVLLRQAADDFLRLVPAD
ncbi:MAG: hypothetical protein ACRDGM_04365 [bacterium]